MAENENDVALRPNNKASDSANVNDEENEEGDDMDDVHRCGKCKLDFTSIEQFIRHKLEKDNCKIMYKSRHRRVLLPHLVKRPIKTEVIAPPVQEDEGTKENLQEQQPVKRKRGRPPKSKQKKSHIELSAIIDRANYECLQCKRTFHRAATLRRHMEMIHEAATLSDEEDGYAALQDDNLEEDAADKEFTASSIVNPSSQGVKIIRAGGDVPVVEDVTGTAEGSNLEAFAQALDTLQSMNESGEQTTSIDAAMLQREGQNLVEVALMHAKIIEMHPPTVAEISAIKPKIEDGVERQHECEVCKRRFKELPVLRAHMLTHSNQRDFACPFHGCRYAFKTKGSLKRHVRRHTDERPYKCYMCDRAFRESGALTRHMKSRSPCVTKTDADLPRYGRIQKLVGGIQKPHVQPVQPVHPDSQDPTEDMSVFEMVVGDNMTNEDEIAVVAQRLEAQSAVALVCEACGQQLPSHVKFKLHLQSHIDNLPFHCDKCDFVAETKQQLFQHERSRHSLGVLTIGGEAEDSDGFVPGEDVPEENFGRIPKDNIGSHNEELQVPVAASEEKDVIVNETDIEGIETCEVNLEATKFDGEVSSGTRSCDGEGNQRTIVPIDGEVIVHHILTTGDEPDQPTLTGGPECEVQVEVSNEEGLEENDTTVHLIIDRVRGPVEGETQQEPSNVDMPERDETADEHEMEDHDANADGSLQLHSYVEPMQVESEPKKCPSDVARAELEELKRRAAIALDQMFKLGYKTTLASTANKDLRDKKFRNHKKCPYCMRTFRGSSYLRLHMRTHTGERPHKCAHCLKGFTTRDALNKHLYTHTDQRQYKCGECGKLFKRISHVREHLKIHTGVRPFVCQDCGKGFKTHNACKVHNRTHSFVMPWQCHTCNKRFREKGSLERHIRTHTGNKPYPCPHCNRKFAEHGTLSRHLKAKVPCTRSLFLQRQADMAEGGPAQEEPMEEYPTLLAEFSSVVADTQQYMIPTTSRGQTEPNDTTEVVIMGTQEQTEGESDIIEIIADENNQIINEDGTTAYVILNQSGDKITVLDSKTGETLELIQRIEDDMDDVIQGSQYVTIATDESINTSAYRGEVISSAGVTEDQMNEAIAIVTEQPIDASTLDIQGAIEQAGEIEAVAMVPDSVEDNVNSINVEHGTFSATE